MFKISQTVPISVSHRLKAGLESRLSGTDSSLGRVLKSIDSTSSSPVFSSHFPRSTERNPLQAMGLIKRKRALQFELSVINNNNNNTCLGNMDINY